MGRDDILHRMQSRIVSIDQFNFDNLAAPPLLSLLSAEDIFNLNQIAMSVRLSGNPTKKYKMIDDILKPRGFVKLSAGTNRVVYKHLEYDFIVLKVAYDAVGIKDNPREFKNQHYFKPFVTKIFEVSPCGTVAVVERVDNIKSREEFYSVANEVFMAINQWFIGKYIMADIGSKFFMNWGIRRGFGPVLLDYPYAYELDHNKIYCNLEDEFGTRCNGLIDYDDGFNFLVCKKCGASYRVAELAKGEEQNKIIINRRTSKMSCKVGKYVNGVVVFPEENDGLRAGFTHVRHVEEKEEKSSASKTIVKKSGLVFNNGPKKVEEKAIEVSENVKEIVEVEEIAEATKEVVEEKTIEVAENVREIVEEETTEATKEEVVEEDVSFGKPVIARVSEEVAAEKDEEPEETEEPIVYSSSVYSLSSYDGENQLLFVSDGTNMISVDYTTIIDDDDIAELLKDELGISDIITSKDKIIKDLELQIEELKKENEVLKESKANLQERVSELSKDVNDKNMEIAKLIDGTSGRLKDIIVETESSKDEDTNEFLNEAVYEHVTAVQAVTINLTEISNEISDDNDAVVLGFLDEECNPIVSKETNKPYVVETINGYSIKDLCDWAEEYKEIYKVVSDKESKKEEEEAKEE